MNLLILPLNEHAQISLVTNNNPFHKRTTSEPQLARPQIDLPFALFYEKLTILELQLARPRFPWFPLRILTNKSHDVPVQNAHRMLGDAEAPDTRSPEVGAWATRHP